MIVSEFPLVGDRWLSFGIFNLNRESWIKNHRYFSQLSRFVRKIAILIVTFTNVPLTFLIAQSLYFNFDFLRNYCNFATGSYAVGGHHRVAGIQNIYYEALLALFLGC